ncbi:DNA-binding transcriptional regulator [Alkalispirochaeta sphaeroplastigenens]|uniref:DNA-binding transcriptional regulator n=2 Tax=Alkalispirochaeta sphaeroplastigenens TaxID=1187066 RepID=A0A2S4JH00_9SPIO|nr:DNA-binding transcriptional regulator [Alkalispirochaeta sphaeroplastigenens]
MAKSDRMQQIERLLLDQPDGLSRSEIAGRLGVHRSTIGRDITSLTSILPLQESDSGRLFLDKKGYLTTIRLTMFELEALHLAARLFARVMKFPFPHASAALRKLADAQGRVSIRLADRIRETAEEIERFPSGSGHQPGVRYRAIMEQLGIAITEYRPIEVTHYSRNHDEDRIYRLVPLTLEPHHEGRSVHLLAWDLDSNNQTDGKPGIPLYHTSSGRFRTLKIERIRKIILLEPDEGLLKAIPVEKIPSRLMHAWGIWAGDTPPVQVVLRFGPAVADRVSETLWHGSQTLEPQQDGGVIWNGAVTEPREMYPWIRGWGPDVEVIEPSWLREEHRQDFERGLEVYRESKREKETFV